MKPSAISRMFSIDLSDGGGDCDLSSMDGGQFLQLLDGPASRGDCSRGLAKPAEARSEAKGPPSRLRRFGGQPPRVSRAEAGEPGGNRTPNPQIKSLLLCQLSYRPGGCDAVILRGSLTAAQTEILTWLLIHCDPSA